MKNLGWRPNEPWIEEVRVTKDLPWDKADLAIKLPRSQWAEWGIQYPDGSAVPADAMHGFAAAADGAQRAGVPRLPELRHLHGVEQLAELRDDRRLSRHAHRRRRRDEPRARRHQRPRCAQAPRSCSRSSPAAATTSARSTALPAPRRAAAVKDMQIKLGLPPIPTRRRAALRPAPRRQRFRTSSGIHCRDPSNG